MMKTTKTFARVTLTVWCMLLLAEGAGPSRAVAAPGGDQLTGKWVVEMSSDDAKTKPFEDTLTFKAGKLESAKLKKEGFKETEYEADVRGGQAATFAAKATGTKGGKAKGTGTAEVGELSGTVVWTKADGGEVTYNFKGKREAK